MKTTRPAKPRRHAPDIPPLYNGDRLTQKEFHRRYEAMPEDVKAELIGGIVYMASPLSEDHGEFHVRLSTVLGLYQMFTPGLISGDNVTTILDDDSEPQPDLYLRVHPESGGQSSLSASHYIIGAPELVAEIAHSSEAIDLGTKRLDYLRNGVCEYFVYCTRDGSIHWFHFPSRRKLRADKAGIFRSKAFPGLWIDGQAFATGDGPRLIGTVQAGLATPDHVAFVEELARRRTRK